MASKTWSEKMAEARARNKAKLAASKAKAKQRRPSAYSSALNDAFDIVGQLAGVTDEWSGQKKKRRR